MNIDKRLWERVDFQAGSIRSAFEGGMEFDVDFDSLTKVAVKSPGNTRYGPCSSADYQPALANVTPSQASNCL